MTANRLIISMCPCTGSVLLLYKNQEDFMTTNKNKDKDMKRNMGKFRVEENGECVCVCLLWSKNTT